MVNKEGKIVLKDENKQITINGTTYNLNLFFLEEQNEVVLKLTENGKAEEEETEKLAKTPTSKPSVIPTSSSSLTKITRSATTTSSPTPPKKLELEVKTDRQREILRLIGDIRSYTVVSGLLSNDYISDNDKLSLLDDIAPLSVKEITYQVNNNILNNVLNVINERLLSYSSLIVSDNNNNNMLLLLASNNNNDNNYKDIIRLKERRNNTIKMFIIIVLIQNCHLVLNINQIIN